MKDRVKIYLDKIVKLLVDDTVIDYDNEGIYFPFMGFFMSDPPPYPFKHLTPNHYIFLSKIGDTNKREVVPPFIRYCKDNYGLNNDETNYVWDHYIDTLHDIFFDY